MITLHIGKLLEDNNLGKLVLTGSETGELIFFEKLPVNKNGVFIMSRGEALNRGQRTAQSFDIYARGSNDINGAKRLENILEFFTKDCYPSCTLPLVSGYSTNKYTKTIIMPTSNITNVGVDASDRVIYVCSAIIYYNKEN